MSDLNKKQVGGEHYKGVDQEHWDWVHANELDYLEKYIELESEKIESDRQIPMFPTTVGDVHEANLKQGKLNVIKDNPQMVKSTGMKHPFGYDEEEDNVNN